MKEKRRDMPRIGSDRRIIERFSDARVTNSLKQTQLWLRILSGLILSVAVGEIVEGFLQGEARQFLWKVFVSTFLILLTVLFLQFSAAITFFLDNESVENLSRTFERQHTFWKTVGIFSVLFTAIYIVLKI